MIGTVFTSGRNRGLRTALALSLLLLGGMPAMAQTLVCNLDGAKVVEGEGRAFYSARSVPKGQSCDSVAQTRTCDAGDMSGSDSYRYHDCITLEYFLGANVNRRPGLLMPELLEVSETDWIRANVDILMYEAQDKAGSEDKRWQYGDWDVFKAAVEDDDRKAILNLMWDFGRYDIAPPAPGSKREAELFAYLDTRILDDLAPYADIIVSGNEPFVNTREQDWAFNKKRQEIPLVAFYERVTEHVNDYLVENDLRDRIDLYMGAFTRLHTKKMQDQPALKALLGYAENASFVDGIDLHTHVTTVKQLEKALKFARQYSTKPMLVTEFSFVWRTKKGLEDGTLGPEFAKAWGYDPNTKTTDYLACNVFGMTKGCRKDWRVSQAEWNDFMASREWWLDNFILDSYKLFQEYGVRGSTFVLTQDDDGPSRKQMSTDRPPWYMGGLFYLGGVEPPPDGSPQTNYQYLDDYLAIQNSK